MAVNAAKATDATPDYSNGVKDRSRAVAWYQDTLSRVPQVAREVLQQYSKVPEKQLLEHIYRVRDQAWDVMPFPCIGVFRFLDFPACLSPVYPEVLSRVRNGETFLDLGCCFGQDIRKLAHDGAPSHNLIGVDLEPRFLELGYELFRDRDTLRARFQAADVFDPNFLADLAGKVDIIFVGSFLHLFDFDQQKAIVAQLGKLLRPKAGSLVFGRHRATANEGGITKANALGWTLFHHSEETMERLWAEAPVGKWEVSSNLVPYQSEGWTKSTEWQGGDVVMQQYFSAKWRP
ncbi:S-adenosyl-L-methionine-dependent methyltransferase [Xylariomycetidae sp. FL2044]|nr:S-adenosyl-L-methionine-dependent methyltransferase [Xylariomycetidae sp. FL2044]